MHRRWLAGLLEPREQQVFSDMHHHCAAAHIAKDARVLVGPNFIALADDTFKQRPARANHSGRQQQFRVGRELGTDGLVGEVSPVSRDARERNGELVPLLDGLDARCLFRLGRLWHDRLGSEVERDAENVGILDFEKPLLVDLVGLPP